MYQIRLAGNAAKSLRKLDRQIQQRIISYLEQPSLLQNPKSLGKTLLYDKKGIWRYRIGDYRVICKIIEKELVVLALDIGHRKQIYE